jgi:lipopolysaccharide/colanic/teichoic acid biosynthesis glycosyltransferase
LLIPLLKGEMSLVGPQLLKVSDDASALQWNELRQFADKPGLTGNWLLEARGKSLPMKAGKAASQRGADESLAKDLAILMRTATLPLRSSRKMEKGEKNHARTGRQRQ